MFNKSFYLIFILILYSIIIYILCLLAIFNVFPLSEEILNIIWSYNDNSRIQYFILVTIAVVIALFVPNFLAVICYLKQKATKPEMKHEFSAFWRLPIDLIMTVPILIFLYNLFLIKDFYEDGYYHQDWSLIIQGSIGFILILSFIFAWFFQTYNFLKNVISEQDARKYLKTLTYEPPYINFNVHAYHYETRIRIVTETHTDSEGKTHHTTRLETYQEQVTTLNISKPYNIKFWRDTTNSKVLLSPQKFPMVKVKISSVIKPIDSQTRLHYKTEYSNFCRQYKGADTHVNYSVNSGINRMTTNSLLVLLELNKRPFFLNILFYFIMSFTPFAWAYTLWLDQISAVSEKTIFKNYSQFKRP